MTPWFDWLWRKPLIRKRHQSRAVSLQNPLLLSYIAHFLITRRENSQLRVIGEVARIFLKEERGREVTLCHNQTTWYPTVKIHPMFHLGRHYLKWAVSNPWCVDSSNLHILTTVTWFLCLSKVIGGGGRGDPQGILGLLDPHPHPHPLPQIIHAYLLVLVYQVKKK